MKTIPPDELHSVVERIVAAAGTPQEGATLMADHLVGSHLAGHDSHGVQHLSRYIGQVKSGVIVPDAVPEIVSEVAGAVLVKGNWAWGQITTDYMTKLGIEKASTHKVALISGVQVTHIGRLGHYVEQASRAGIMIWLMTGGQGVDAPLAAPHGGRKALFAPNPMALGFPTAEEHPFVWDIATTRVAGGKIQLAHSKGQELPAGWIIDKDGNPSTDPDDYYDGGALLPFGEHKGFGLMVASEILGRILPGSEEYVEDRGGGVHHAKQGAALIAVDAGVFTSAEQFSSRTTDLMNSIRAVPPRTGFAEVLAPGDFEHASRKKRQTEGIQIPESTWDEIVETAESLGLKI